MFLAVGHLGSYFCLLVLLISVDVVEWQDIVGRRAIFSQYLPQICEFLPAAWGDI
jgi:hypothetical protein